MASYTIKRGDTLGKIARSYNVPLSTILNLNPQIKNPNLILVGQVINVPDGAGGSGGGGGTGPIQTGGNVGAPIQTEMWSAMFSATGEYRIWNVGEDVPDSIPLVEQQIFQKLARQGWTIERVQIIKTAEGGIFSDPTFTISIWIKIPQQDLSEAKYTEIANALNANIDEFFALNSPYFTIIRDTIRGPGRPFIPAIPDQSGSGGGGTPPGGGGTPPGGGGTPPGGGGGGGATTPLTPPGNNDPLMKGNMLYWILGGAALLIVLVTTQNQRRD